MATDEVRAQNGEPPRVDTVAEIHDALRASILSGELPAGQVLSQVKLARSFDVGRTPLREALRMLQHEGLVEGEYNRRVRVAPFSLADLEQVYALRVMIEAFAVRVSVPHFTDEDLDRLDAAVAEMAQTANADDLEHWEAAHRRLHFGLAAYAGDRTLAQVRTLLDHAQRYRHLFIRTDPIAWHMGPSYDQRIVEACREREAVEASERLARHLGRAALTGVAALAPGHDPAVVRAALRMIIGEESALPGPLP